MENEKCFCHYNGYQVKDAVARNEIEAIKTNVNNVSNEIANTKASMESIGSDVSNSKTDIELMKTDVNSLKTNLSLNSASINVNSENIEANTNDINSLNTNVGDLSTLNTTDKTSVVNAINEVKNDIENLEITGGVSEEEIQEQIDTSIKSIKYNRVVDGKRVYIDGVNGNDETGDGTETNPYKTLEKFFDLANYVEGGRNDIRCYIVSAGEYTLSKHSINHLTIHITGNVEGVILNFTTDRDMKFYECHTNLNNLTIRYPNATEFAFDGGSFAIYNTTFEGQVITYSCSGKMESVTMKNIQCNESNVTLWKTNLTNKATDISGYYFVSSNVRLMGATTFAELSATGTGTNGLISANNSRVTIQFTPTENSKKYSYGIYANGCIFFMSSARLEAFQERFPNGIGYGDTKNLYVTDSASVK